MSKKRKTKYRSAIELSEEENRVLSIEVMTEVMKVFGPYVHAEEYGVKKRKIFEGLLVASKKFREIEKRFLSDDHFASLDFSPWGAVATAYWAWSEDRDLQEMSARSAGGANLLEFTEALEAAKLLMEAIDLTLIEDDMFFPIDEKTIAVTFVAAQYPNDIATAAPQDSSNLTK